MTVEIQTFLFAHDIRTHSNGLVDFLTAPIFRMDPHDGNYPARITLSYYLLLRKETYDSSPPITITIKIIDQDAVAVHLLEGDTFARTGTFAAGERFLGVSGHLHATFLKPCEYTVVASVVSDGHTAEQHYVIDLF